MKHIISVIVENKPGVLARVSGLFSRRGFNIDSLAVGVSENPRYSRMTIVVHGNDTILEQITKQLNKLIDVYKVIDLTSGHGQFVAREMVFFKVNTNVGSRSEIMQIVDIFRGRMIDVGEKTMVIELTGSEEKIIGMQNLLSKFGIIEIVRTGKIALSRGSK
jgi:acetolactate synthase I/III small subunit